MVQKKLVIKVILLLMLCLLGFIGGFLVYHLRCFPYENLRQSIDIIKGKMELFPKAGEGRHPVFIIGDSIARRGDWRFLEKNYAPVNIAVGGAVIDDTLELVNNNEAISEGRAIIILGYNDISTRPVVNDVIDRYKKLLDLLEERQIKPLVLAIPESPGEGSYDRRPLIRVVNEQLKILCFKKGVSFLNLNDVWSDENGVKYGLTSDLTHLTSKAYELAREEILKHLNK
jgi:hypothetical protein